MSNAGNKPYMEYTEELITAFIDLAKDVGIGPAMRELGYPKQWVTANKWCKARGIETPKTLTQQVATAHALMYTLEDKLIAGYKLLDRIMEQLEAVELDADSVKKLAETYKKTIETIQILEGKAISISQNNDVFDSKIQALIDMENNKNMQIESQDFSAIDGGGE